MTYNNLLKTFSLEQLIKEAVALDDLVERTNKEQYKNKLSIVKQLIFIKIDEIIWE